jgi:hypothetical protein
MPAGLPSTISTRKPWRSMSPPWEKPTTVEGLLHTARAERLPPAEGGIDIAAILTRMPDHTQITLEIPMHWRTALEGPEAAARRVHDTTVRLLAAMP